MLEAWSFSETPASRDRLYAELARRGYARVRPIEADLDAGAAARAPWEVTERVFGVVPELVERQPIAPVAWGKSYASTSGDTPLHTDSQLHRNLPPHAQLMFCERSAERGGETLLVDTWALLERIERDDRTLFEWLFRRRRRIPFIFGDVDGTTVSNRGGCLVFTHSPRPFPEDEVAARIARVLAKIEPLWLRIGTGELVIVDNHRMLHGRTAFEDTERRFTRLLAWLPRPFGEAARYLERAEIVPVPSVEPEIARRRRAVIDMLRGVPPGVLAQRLEVPEKILYRWRDAALAAAAAALDVDYGQP